MYACKFKKKTKRYWCNTGHIANNFIMKKYNESQHCYWIKIIVMLKLVSNADKHKGVCFETISYRYRLSWLLLIYFVLQVHGQKDVLFQIFQISFSKDTFNGRIGKLLKLSWRKQKGNIGLLTDDNLFINVKFWDRLHK